MKKIVFFSKDLSIGGMEISLISLLNSLVNDYKVTLILEEKKGELIEKLNSKITVKEFQLSKTNIVIFRKITNFLKRVFWLLRNYHKYDFSCNYATYSVIGSRLSLYASKNNALYVHSDYYSAFGCDDKKTKNFFKKEKINYFKNILIVSNEAKNNLLKVYPKLRQRVHVINNIFDFSRYHVLEKKHDNIIFLFIGRLDDSSKKLTRLFDAVELLDDKLPFKLLVVGDGPDKDYYQEYVSKKNLDKYIKFYPKTNDVSKYINMCDYIVLSSDYEGFPVVYLEAIYFKKPILTTIKTSDHYLNIEKYAIITQKDPLSIKNGMIRISKQTFDMSFDFKKYNESNLFILKKIINS